MNKKLISMLLAVLLVLTSVFSLADGMSLEKVNEFLNNSAKLGEGSKANSVAVIPINHIDGPQEEDLFYAFVPFKYVARNYIKYQVMFISCTCRTADVNLWSTAYVELTLPESGLIQDSKVKFLSFDADSTGHYLGGFWGDSNPGPGGQTYEQFKKEFVPFFVDKSYGELKSLSTIADLALTDYQKGEGRESYTLDTWTGATVSANNILRMVQALFAHHASDPFFAKDPAVAEMMSMQKAAEPAAEQSVQAPVVSGEEAELPSPVDTSKTYKPNKDAKEEVPCTPGVFGPTCSSINASNLRSYLNRSDVFYIDTRDHNDYMKKHLRNFEVIPFFGLVFDANAHTDESKVQLYGGTPQEPIPVYKESDEILAALFPKDKTLFLMCQSGGRVGMLMNILKARGWDMSKVYNVGGMAQYAGPEYKDLVTDTPELTMQLSYSMEGLTRIAPAK